TNMTPGRPSAALPHQVDGALDLALIGISAIDDGHRHAMRAEYDIEIRLDAFETGVDAGDHGIEVRRVLVERLDHTHIRAPAIGMEAAIPLVDTASGGGFRKLR